VIELSGSSASQWGTRDLHFYQKEQIKRVRVVRRADGYYVQFGIDQERMEKHEPTNPMVGIDEPGNLTIDSGNPRPNQRLWTGRMSITYCPFEQQLPQQSWILPSQCLHRARSA